jgi:hypothetical protein
MANYSDLSNKLIIYKIQIYTGDYKSTNVSKIATAICVAAVTKAATPLCCCTRKITSSFFHHLTLFFTQDGRHICRSTCSDTPRMRLSLVVGWIQRRSCLLLLIINTSLSLFLLSRVIQEDLKSGDRAEVREN